MYKGVSGNAQRGRDKITLGDIAAAGLPEVQTDEQKRSNLVRVLKSIDQQLSSCADLRERRKLGARKHALQQEINAIRPKRRCKAANDFFIDAARDLLPKATFQLILHEAAQRALKTEGADDGAR